MSITSGSVADVVGPYMNKVFLDTYNKAEAQYDMIFKNIDKPTPRSQHQEVMLAGLGAAQRLNEGMQTPLINSGTMYQAIYNYEQYALGFAITDVAYEDGEHMGLGEAYSEYLGRSFVEAKEINAANVLNFGFNAGVQTGGDGVALFSNSHPLKFGGTDSNLLPSAAFSQTSMEDATIRVRKALAFDGTHAISVKIKKVVLPPELENQGKIILNSQLRTGTTANDINPLFGATEGLAVLTRLTSANAWFVTTNCGRGLQLAQRVKLERRSEPDFNTASLQFAGRERYKFYWTDWHGAYGNQGI